MTTPITATNLSFRYDRGEDRLQLAASDRADETVSLLLTRRLTASLIEAVAATLERSSQTAAKAQADMRADVVLLEHQGAIQLSSGKPQKPSPGNPQDKTPPLPKPDPRDAVLVDRITLTTKPKGFVLIFRSGEADLVICRLDRASLHRVLDAVLRHAESAAWNIPASNGWLSRSTGAMVIN